MRYLAPFILLVAGTFPSFAQENTVLRYVEFRNGSLLRLPVVNEQWSVSWVRSDGQIETRTVRPSQIRNMTLSDEEDTDQKLQILSAVQQLGSEEFLERETAWKTLKKMGSAIRPELEASLDLTTSVETRIRLQALLKELPAEKETSSRISFDQFVTDKPFRGYWGNKTIQVIVNGKTISLTRKAVKRITVKGLGERFDSAEQIAVAGFSLLSEKEIPPESLKEPCERGADGKRFKVGEEVDQAFLDKGLVLSTSTPQNKMVIQKKVVTGSSWGHSLAGQTPFPNGETVIRFVEPGQAHIPAAVTHFSCWAANDAPGVMEWQAYDVTGLPLGKIRTEGTDSVFVGLASTIPIHKICIVPLGKNPNRIFLDDFRFLPASSALLARPERFVVRLTEGDLIFCKDVILEAEQARLVNLSSGLPDFNLPVDRIQRINFPAADKAKSLPVGVYAQLTDGSILFGREAPDKRGQPHFARCPDLFQTPGQVVGLWRSEFPRFPQPLPDKQTAAWYPEKNQWKPITFARLLEELVLWKTDKDQFDASGYQKLPPVWLQQPVSPPPGCWQIQTPNREVLVLARDQGVSGRLSEGIRIVWQNQSLQLSPHEVVSLYQMMK